MDSQPQNQTQGPETLKSLARRYGVGVKRLKKWLMPHLVEIGWYNGRGFTPTQLSAIERLIGKPPEGRTKKG